MYEDPARYDATYQMNSIYGVSQSAIQWTLKCEIASQYIKAACESLLQ